MYMMLLLPLSWFSYDLVYCIHTIITTLYWVMPKLPEPTSLQLICCLQCMNRSYLYTLYTVTPLTHTEHWPSVALHVLIQCHSTHVGYQNIHRLCTMLLSESTIITAADLLYVVFVQKSHKVSWTEISLNSVPKWPEVSPQSTAITALSRTSYTPYFLLGLRILQVTSLAHTCWVCERNPQIGASVTWWVGEIQALIRVWAAA